MQKKIDHVMKIIVDFRISWYGMFELMKNVETASLNAQISVDFLKETRCVYINE